MDTRRMDRVLYLYRLVGRAWGWVLFYRRRGDLESARRWFRLYRRALEAP